ncbi:MAG: Spore coat protein SA [candidate division WS2 bacterium]|nr:Spore coat protein SA [Candidatus Lithacetigena glycinireducens]
MLQKIVVDCKIIALQDTGISGFFKPLLKQIMHHFKDVLFYLVTPRKFDLSFLDGAENYKIIIAPFPMAPKMYFKYILYGLFTFPATLRTLQADLLLSPYYDFVIPLNYQNKAIITVYDLCFWDVGHLYPLRVKWFHQMVLLKNIKRAAKIITVSEFSKDRLIKVFAGKVQLPDIQIVYSSFDQKWMHTKIGQHEVDELVRKLNVVGKRCLIYTGGSDNRKNIPYMFRALQKVVEKNNDVRLLFTGNNKRNAKLIKLIRRYQLDRHIVLTDFLTNKELSILYRHVCIGAINLSLYEGFGRNNLEAKYSGLPILCSDIPVTREVVGNYPIYCDPADIQSITEGMYKLLYETHRKDAVELDDRFNLACNSKKLVDIIDGVLNGK